MSEVILHDQDVLRIMLLCFDDVEINKDRHELLRCGQIQHIEPKVFNLLIYLAENTERVITTDELIEAVWNGRIVSDTTISGCVKHARKAVGDDGSKQNTIKTVRGRGFRFCRPVKRVEQDTDGNQNADVSASHFKPGTSFGASSQTAKFNPSLVIQPFQVFPKSADMDSFCQRLSMALTKVLARVPLLRLTILSGEIGSATAREVHDVMGVDYVLRGNAASDGEHVRVMVQLIDAKTDFFLWSHQFQVPGKVDDAHDAAVLAIVAKLEPQLHRAISENVRSSTRRPNALELYFKASGILALKGWHHDSFGTAAGLLRESWKKAPEFAHASSYLSLVLGLGHRLGLMSDVDRIKEEALHAAEHALNLESMDSSVLGLAGCALGDLGHSSRAMSTLKQAVDLNPDNGQAWAALGSVCLSDRRVDDAVSHLRRGIELSPHDSRLSVWGGVLSTALRVSGDLTGAVEQAEMACQRGDRTYMPRVILAAAHLVSGNQRCASLAFEDAYRIKPDMTDKQITYLIGKRHTGDLLKLRP